MEDYTDVEDEEDDGMAQNESDGIQDMPVANENQNVISPEVKRVTFS